LWRLAHLTNIKQHSGEALIPITTHSGIILKARVLTSGPKDLPQLLRRLEIQNSHAASAILPGMAGKRSVKPGIAIVGAGNLASALTVALRAAGYSIEHIISRARPSSLRQARKLAREVGASAVSIAQTQISADVVWFCVPDAAIASSAASLENGVDWKGRIALHSSGVLTSDALTVLRQVGAATASVHPLMTFVRDSRPPLAGVAFAMEGSPKAVRAARAIVKNLRGRSFPIRKDQKDAYHAWGMFSSPLLTALLAAAERVAAAAGVPRPAARTRMLPILNQTLTNYSRLGAPPSFSGPIARGDVATVAKHLKILGRVPAAREVYVALARSALRDLPAKNRPALEKLLKTSLSS
jgi:predicted short-subunit dehydrogenase-like oxidoreductase (DUF2520 family)